MIFGGFGVLRGERDKFSAPFRGIVIGGGVELLGKRGGYIVATPSPRSRNRKRDRQKEEEGQQRRDAKTQNRKEPKRTQDTTEEKRAGSRPRRSRRSSRGRGRGKGRRQVTSIEMYFDLLSLAHSHPPSHNISSTSGQPH